jgi:hypothetical protein
MCHDRWMHWERRRQEEFDEELFVRCRLDLAGTLRC